MYADKTMSVRDICKGLALQHHLLIGNRASRLDSASRSATTAAEAEAVTSLSDST